MVNGFTFDGTTYSDLKQHVSYFKFHYRMLMKIYKDVFSWSICVLIYIFSGSNVSKFLSNMIFIIFHRRNKIFQKFYNFYPSVVSLMRWKWIKTNNYLKNPQWLILPHKIWLWKLSSPKKDERGHLCEHRFE